MSWVICHRFLSEMSDNNSAPLPECFQGVREGGTAWIPMLPTHSACQFLKQLGQDVYAFNYSGDGRRPHLDGAFWMGCLSCISAWPSAAMNGTAAAESSPMRPSRLMACSRLAGSSADNRSIRCGTAARASGAG